MLGIFSIKVLRTLRLFFYYVDSGISLVQKKFSSIISLHSFVLFFRNTYYAYPLSFISIVFYFSLLSLLFSHFFHYPHSILLALFSMEYINSASADANLFPL